LLIHAAGGQVCHFDPGAPLISSFLELFFLQAKILAAAIEI